jgi:phytoene desaturase
MSMQTLQAPVQAVHADPTTGVAHAPLALVIGSGFGGLASPPMRLSVPAATASTVLEKLDAPGGRAYVHRQDGYTFDAGPTIVTAPFLFEELWALCGRRMADDIDAARDGPLLPACASDDGSCLRLQRRRRRRCARR